MTLKEMCQRAAELTDRADDFVTVKNPDTGEEWYDPNDDPGIWYNIMKQGINTAYREVARRMMMPDMRIETELGKGGRINLLELKPGVSKVKAVYNADGSYALQYDFITQFEIKVRDGREGQDVIVHYAYVPDAMERFTDEPIFPESLVDPAVYIAMAASKIWATERKFQAANYHQAEYYALLASIKSDVKSSKDRRIRRSVFR